MQQHPIAAVADRLGAVLPPARIDAHAGKRMAAPPERLLQGGVVGAEAAMHRRQVFVGAKRNLQRIEGAVEGEFIACPGIRCSVERTRVIRRRIREVEPGQKLFNRCMDGVKIGCGTGCEVPYRKLQFNANTPRAFAAQWSDETRIKRIV